MLETSNRSLDALVSFENKYHWKPGLNIVAEVELGVHEKAIVLSQRSLVRRPEGLVVYKFIEGKARQQLVKTGLEKKGLVEILKGVAQGEVVILDGAPFLSDGTAVHIVEK